MVEFIRFTDANTNRHCIVPLDKIISINETEDKRAFIEMYFDSTGGSYGTATKESFIEISTRLELLKQNGLVSILTKLGNDIVISLKDIKK